MQKIPKDRFRRLNETQRIAVTTTNIRDYTGKLKLIVIKEEDENPPLHGTDWFICPILVQAVH